jgi:hypothetical protein
VILIVAQIVRVEQQPLSHAFEAVVTHLLRFTAVRAEPCLLLHSDTLKCENGRGHVKHSGRSFLYLSHTPATCPYRRPCPCCAASGTVFSTGIRPILSFG